MPSTPETQHEAVRWLPLEAHSLQSVVAATLDDQGTLLQANAGFMRMLSKAQGQNLCTSASDCFAHPDFASLKRAAGNNVASGAPGTPVLTGYCGLMNFHNEVGNARTLHGRFWQSGGQWHLLAEFDIEELERVYKTMLALNQQAATSQTQLAQANFRLQQREAQILASSLTDPLTGIGNRRLLDQALPLEIGRAARTHAPLSAIMCDIDHFKRVNDRYGHDAGDSVLAKVGEILRTHMRPTDIVTRFGGEEFVLLTPDADLHHALEAAQRLRTLIATTDIAPLDAPVTASFGVAQLQTGEPGASLLKRIDTALYAAKQAGRNRVEQG